MDWLLIAITWLLLCGAVVPLARRRGRSGTAWLLAAVILSPILAMIWILCLENLTATRRHHELLQAVSRTTGPRQPLRGPRNHRPQGPPRR